LQPLSLSRVDYSTAKSLDEAQNSSSNFLEVPDGPLFVSPHHGAVANHVGGKDRS
jgi:hypothetical protein